VSPFSLRSPNWVLVLPLLACGCKESGSKHPIFDAAFAGDVAKVREALDAEPDLVHAGKAIRTGDKFVGYRNTDSGRTPLHFAALGGHLPVAELLLERGAKADALASTRYSANEQPIHYAAMGRHLAILQLLVNKGADVRARGNRSNSTCLHYVFVDIDPYLPEKKTASWTRDDNPRYKGNMGEKLDSTILWLLDNGVDVNAQDEAGNTALHHLAARGDNAGWETAQAMKLLIGRGADLHAKNKDGLSPQELIDTTARLKRESAEHQARWHAERATRPVVTRPVAPRTSITRPARKQ